MATLTGNTIASTYTLLLKMASGGYFGHKIQDYLRKTNTPKRRKDDE